VRRLLEGLRAIGRGRRWGRGAISLGALVVLMTGGAFEARSAPGPGPGSEGDPDVLDVRADKLEVDWGSARAVLDGHVQLRRGDILVTCPRVEGRFDGSARLLSARGLGPVTADFRGTHAEADDVEVDMSQKVIRLKGHVKVTRGGARMTAERGTIEFASAHLTLEEVHGVLPGPLAPGPGGVPSLRPP
jgi:lipopolysaccharide export system protein LptA